MIHSRNSDISRKNGRNLLRFHGDAAVTAVDDAAVNYQAPSIITAGADAQSISILTTLVNLCLSLLCIKAPALIERIGKGKRGAVTLAFLNLCAWVPLILMFLLAPMGISPVWFAFLWCINLIPGILLTFQRDNWLSNLVPQDKLGRYLGQRLAIKSAFYLGAFCFLGYMLDSFSNTSLVNFAFVFTVALAVALVDFVIFTFMYEPKKEKISLPEYEDQKIKFGLFDFIGELRAKKLDGFVIFTSLFYLTVGLSGPLYAVYMLQEKHFTYLNYTVIVSAEYLARVVSAPFWGRFADKAGNIRVLGIVSRIIPVIPICWLFCSNIGYLAFVQTFSGICWGAFDLCTQSYVFKIAPKEKKLRYIVYTRCFILLSTALGGLMGVYMIRGTFTIFGSQVLSVFLISGISRAIIVIFLMPKLVDMAISYVKPVASPNINIDTSGMAKVTRHGLFYQRPASKAVPLKNQIIKKDTSVSFARPQNNLQRRNWAANERVVQQTKKEISELLKGGQIMPQRHWTVPEKEGKGLAPRVEITPSRRPWFKDSEILAAYGARGHHQSLAMQEENNRQMASREGLFYNSDAWSNYRKESLQAAIREIRKWKGASNLKPVWEESEPGWRPWRDSNPRPTA